MAEQPADIHNLINQFRTARRKANTRVALGFPGYVAESVASGRDPAQVWRERFGPKQGIDPAAAIKAKQDILENLSAMEAARQKTGSELVKEAMKGNPDFVKNFMDMFAKLQGARIGGDAQIRAAQIGNTEEVADFLEKSLSKQLLVSFQKRAGPEWRQGGPKEAEAKKLAERLRSTINSYEPNPKMVGEVVQYLTSARPGWDYAAARKLVDEYIGEPGALDQWLETNANHTEVKQLMARDEEILTNLHEGYPPYSAAMEEIMGEAADNVFKSSGVRTGLEQMAPALIETMRQLEDAGIDVSALFGTMDPTKLKQVADVILRDPDGINPEDDWRNLLEAVDRYAESEPTIAEMKQQIMASPQFREFMAQAGFNDPAFAWKELLRQSREQQFKDRQEDRRRLNENANARAKGPPEPSDGASLAGTAPGQDPEPVEPPKQGTNPEEVKALAVAAFQSGESEGFRVYWPDPDEDRAIIEAPDGSRVELTTPEEIEAVIEANPAAFDEVIQFGAPPEVAAPTESPAVESEEVGSAGETLAGPASPTGGRGINTAVAGALNVVRQGLTGQPDETFAKVKAGVSKVGESLAPDPERRRERLATKVGTLESKGLEGQLGPVRERLLQRKKTRLAELMGTGE